MDREQIVRVGPMAGMAPPRPAGDTGEIVDPVFIGIFRMDGFACGEFESMAVDTDGIATITWDLPGASMNVLNEEGIRELDALVDKVLADDVISRTEMERLMQIKKKETVDSVRKDWESELEEKINREKKDWAMRSKIQIREEVKKERREWEKEIDERISREKREWESKVRIRIREQISCCEQNAFKITGLKF